MLIDLCGLLMRFRLYRIALVTAIENVFLQIGLQISWRDGTRFVWINTTKKLELIMIIFRSTGTVVFHFM